MHDQHKYLPRSFQSWETQIFIRKLVDQLVIELEKKEQEIIYILLVLKEMEGRYRRKCKVFAEAYLGPYQTSLTEFLMKICNR